MADAAVETMPAPAIENADVVYGIPIQMEPAALFGINFGKILEDVSKPILQVVAPVVNVAVDTATRGYNEIAGNMNNDINEDSGPQTSLGALVPGDILIKHGGPELDTQLIRLGQVFFNRFNHIYKSASELSHCAVYIGNGEIAEAISEGIVKHPLENYRGYNWHVIRVRDTQLRNEIVSLAHLCLETRSRGTYGHHVLLSAGLNLESWEKAYGLDPTRSDLERVLKGDAVAMICVELVAFCIAAGCDRLGRPRVVNRSQSNITPSELYVALRGDQSQFEYIGKIRKH